jgi:TonB family protein
MRSTKRAVRSFACALALVANASLAGAQQQPPRQPQPRAKQEAGEGAVKDRIMFEAQIAEPGAADALAQGVVIASQTGGGHGISLLATELSYDGRVVRGAPYSAEAVTESVQVLPDGNRITRKTTAMLYRDSEGRTRRDQTMTALGPFATAEDPPQTVFINDPVAGVNYVLNTRSRTAHKAMRYSFSVGSGGSAKVMTRDPLRTGESFVIQVPQPAASAKGVAELRMSNGGRPVKRVQPVYPAIARAAGAQGSVRVEVVISEQGEVESAQVSSGHPLLREAAVEAAKQWRFEPVQAEGRAVKSKGFVTFEFTLSGKEKEGHEVEEGARKAVVELHAAQQARESGIMRVQVPGEPGELPEFKTTKESLGKQSVEGVEAEGTRTTVTIPAGAIGNERPILITSERWYSAELQTVVKTSHSDPRFGETVYRLTNINRSEPDRSLFEVPAGFTVVEGGPTFRRTTSLPRKQQEQQF